MTNSQGLYVVGAVASLGAVAWAVWDGAKSAWIGGLAATVAVGFLVGGAILLAARERR
jgi:hypothetical protein